MLQFLCELSMLEADPYLHFLPSHLAASAVALAQHTLNDEVWPHELELSSGYSLKELKTCIICLERTFNNAMSNPQQAIQEKYKNNKCVFFFSNYFMFMMRAPIQQITGRYLSKFIKIKKSMYDLGQKFGILL